MTRASTRRHFVNRQGSVSLQHQTGSDWLRKTGFAQHRIGRIARLLCDDEVNKTIDEVYAEFGKTVDKRHWDIFVNGSEEQRKGIQEEIREEIERILHP